MFSPSTSWSGGVSDHIRNQKQERRIDDGIYCNFGLFVIHFPQNDYTTALEHNMALVLSIVIPRNIFDKG
jgi:hypothetical protein